MEIVARVVFIYFAIMLGLRGLGKREFGELAPFDLVVLLLIPEIVSSAIVGSDFSLTAAFVALATLFGLVIATSVLSFRFPRLDRVISGTPAVIVTNGILIPEQLQLERVSPGEIHDALHRVGLERIDQVKWAILESDGRITVIPRQSSVRLPDPGELHTP